MRVRTLPLVLLIIVSVLTFSAMFAGSITGNDTSSYIQNETYVTANQDPLLGKYEHSNKVFSKSTSGNYTSYHYQRKIGDAVVGFDGTSYIFDEEDNLIDKVVRWRDDLPQTLPSIISKKDAESMVERGKAVELLYIDPELDDIFSCIQPTPKNPCWIVCVYDNSTYISDIVVVDAVKGEILGRGTPPPRPNGYVLTGSKDLVNCTGQWLARAENAHDWFNTMGYTTPEVVVNPSDNEVKGAIQDTDVTVFYEVAHGSDTSFWSRCGDPTSSLDIKDWLENYPEMPFAFLLSCGSLCRSGMISSGLPSLSHAFRKGSYIQTATIGFCGLGSDLDAWRQEPQWQDKFFEFTNNGDTVKESFDLANMYYKDTARCSRFAGDSSLKLVPEIQHRKPYPGDLEGIVSFPGRDKSYDRWVEKLEVHFWEYGSEKSWSPLPAITDRDGYFNVYGVPPGTYDIAIKNWTCLSELETGVVFSGGGGAYVDFGTTREGDCDHTGTGEDWVNYDDYIDILVHYGEPYPNGDFDRDGTVDFDDYVTVLVNYGQKGDLYGV